MANLKISQIYFGKTDAKDDINLGGPQEPLLFDRSFFMPSHVNLDDFVQGRRFYIHGLKGTGKTAFLRYLDRRIRETKTNSTKFILFKSDIDETKREEFIKAMRDPFEVADDNRRQLLQGEYYVIWKWFFHKTIANMLKVPGQKGVKENEHLQKYISCIDAVEAADSPSGIRKLIPNLTKGEVTISKSPSVQIGFDWSDKERRTVRFDKIVDQCDNLFSRLEHAGGYIYIFIDELEPKLGSKRQFERDTKLIRDLVVVVREFNEKSHTEGRWVKFICAIRTEVLATMFSLAMEIDKPIFDFGREFNWQMPVKDRQTHPLIQMICHKIRASGEVKGVVQPKEYSVIWGRYFRYRNRVLTQKDVLHRTWFRPRDLIRLLTLAQENAPDAWVFSDRLMDDVMRAYSRYSWRELLTELSVKYERHHLKGIQQLFTQYRPSFSASDFGKRLKDLSQEYADVGRLREEFTPGDILSDLYRVGVVGNVGSMGMRWVFRGDEEINLHERMGVHRALLKHLSIHDNFVR